MSSFTEPLLAKITQRDRRPIEIAEDFSYYVGMDADKRIVVREGFFTDGATVPIPLSAFVHPLGRHGKAAILHDWLYRWPDWLDIWRDYVPEAKDARHAADMIFLEAMAVLRVPFHRRALIYMAVRAFGWIAWRRIHEAE